MTDKIKEAFTKLLYAEKEVEETPTTSADNLDIRTRIEIQNMGEDINQLDLFNNNNDAINKPCK